MGSISDAIRDLGTQLAALPDDQFVADFNEALASLFPAFTIASATIYDHAGTRIPVDSVVSVVPIQGGEVPADATAVAVYLSASLDIESLREGYERIAQVRALRKTPSAEPGRSTVTLGLIVAAASQVSLDALSAEMRARNREIPDDHRPDMVAVLSRGTINYLATFGPDQATPGEWLPPAQGPRQFVSPTLLHMVTTATTAFALNRLVGYIIGHLVFFAPTLLRPDMQAIIAGVPSHRGIVTMYQYNLAEQLVEVEKPEPVVEPPFLVEGPNRDLLAKLFYQPWQDGGVVILEGLLPLEGLLIFASKQLPLVANKLRDNRQVSAVLPMTFDEYVAMAEQIGKRTNMTVMQQKQEWTIAHIADEGSSTPFYARLWMTPFSLRDSILTSTDEIEQFNATYGSTLNDLTTLRRIGKETLELWNTHVAKVARGEIVRYDNAIHLDETIDEPLSHNLETIIRNAAGAAKLFQELTKLFGLDIGFMFQEDKAFQASIVSLEASDPMLAAYLRETRKWLQPLTLTRNALEHAPYVAPRIQYQRLADRIRVQVPSILGLPLTHFIPTILSRLDRFIEEVLIRAIQRGLPPPLTVVEVPIGSRDPAKPERFKLDLAGSIQPWQIIYSDDDFDQV
jgi:hypothetical protein